MNLYQINFTHYSQKDNESGIKTYLVAENDEEVYKWLASDPKLENDDHIITGWKDAEDDGDQFVIYDDNYEAIGWENKKERMIRLKGDMYDDEEDFDDLYYGKTTYGWKLVNGDITNIDIDTLLDLGVALEIIIIKEDE